MHDDAPRPKLVGRQQVDKPLHLPPALVGDTVEAPVRIKQDYRRSEEQRDKVRHGGKSQFGAVP